jgi:large subunit ribosomal protein L29
MAKNVKVDKKTAKKIAEKKTLAGKIRELTDEQIYAKINELKQELFNLRFQAEVGKLEKTADLRKVKKEIARCYTVLKERANANN